MTGEEQSGADAYAAALDRLLDGLEPEADGPEAAAAGAQASADIDSITRALGLIGNTLAAEGSGVGAAAGAAPPVAEAGGVVVAMSSWRSKLNPRVLAAAAVGLLVIGLGVPIAMSTGGGDSDESANALDAPSAQTAVAPAAPDSATAADTAAGLTATTSGGFAAGSPATDTGAATVPGAANDATTNKTAADTLSAPEAAPAPAAGSLADTAPKSSSAAKRDAATSAFSDAVACARAILVGQITAVQPGSTAGRVKVTLLVTSWITPSTGPALITYEVGMADALTPDGSEKLTAGQRRLFVFPAKPSAQAYAYPDSQESRDKVAAVRSERSGEGC